MSDPQTSGAATASSADPTSSGEGGERSQDHWLDRLKTAVGLKPPASIRDDLAQALADGDQTTGFSPEERAMLANILQLREKRVSDAMIPRAEIESVELGTTLGGLLEAFEDSGHSRMPVYRETLDNPVGFVHIKDLMHYFIKAAAAPAPDGSGDAASRELDLRRVDLSRPLGEAGVVRELLFVPPSMPLTALLAAMQARHMQVALVIDEYGGTDGLVSIEDVVEMVVGEIEDEHDEEGPMIVPDGDDSFLADARAYLDEVAAVVGSELALGDAGEDIDTIGGVVVNRLGRVPVRGELIPFPGGFELEILDADPRRVKRLRIHRPKPDRTTPETRRRPRPRSETPADA